METKAFILVAIACINLALAAFIFMRDRRAETNRVFAVGLFFHALWTLSYVRLVPGTSPDKLAFLANLSLLASVGTATAFLHLSWVFPKRLRLRRRLFFAAWTSGLSVAAASAIIGPPVKSLSFAPGETTFALPSLVAVGGYICIAVAASLAHFYRTARTRHSAASAQARLVGAGFAVAMLAAFLFDLLLPLFGNYQLLWLGPTCSIFLTTATVYAIVAHRLFNFRDFVSRAIGYSALLGVVISLFILFIFFLAQVFNLGGISKADLLPNLLAALLIGFGFDPLRQWLQNRTDRFLFKKEYDQQSIMKELTGKLNSVIALDEAMEAVMESIAKSMRIQKIATLITKPGMDGLLIQNKRPSSQKTGTNFAIGIDDPLFTYLRRITRITVVDAAEQRIDRGMDGPYEVSREAIRRFKELGIELVTPLYLNDQSIGFILLGEKLSQDAFTTKDLALLTLIGSQAVSSIQKAKLYEGDQMKSEFVSIASHELLTPISAMEGYLSMILEEHYGTVDERAHDYLNKVYSSVQRLSLLIKDLLSASRIDSGRMNVDLREADLQKLVQDTVDQLKFVAEDKHLSLVFEQPSPTLPLAWIDPDRTMQVLVNLVSNAIKYSFEGSVTIKLEAVSQPNPVLKLEVIDTGIGMSKQAQAHLFEKFYRIESSQTTGIVGTGLGLYITKSIIEKMGGTISVRSVLGKGTKFTATFLTAPGHGKDTLQA